MYTSAERGLNPKSPGYGFATTVNSFNRASLLQPRHLVFISTLLIYILRGGLDW